MPIQWDEYWDPSINPIVFVEPMVGEKCQVYFEASKCITISESLSFQYHKCSDINDISGKLIFS